MDDMIRHRNTRHKSTWGAQAACALLRSFTPVLLCACALVLFLSGCTQLKQVQNLDELLTLKDFSDEKDSQQKWIDREVARFELLLTAIDDGSVKSLANQDAVRERFGDPVVVDEVQENNFPAQRWLYRHPIQKLASDRVYFFFDDNGRLLRYERVVPSRHDQ